MTPIVVSCPRCGAAAGEGCRNRNSRTLTHSARHAMFVAARAYLAGFRAGVTVR